MKRPPIRTLHRIDANRRAELIESWINGNRRHVADALTTADAWSIAAFVMDFLNMPHTDTDRRTLLALLEETR
jgi:hypothetical protein